MRGDNYNIDMIKISISGNCLSNIPVTEIVRKPGEAARMIHTTPKFNPSDLVETLAASTVPNNQYRHGAIRKLTRSAIADDDELEAGVIHGPLIRERLRKKPQNIADQTHAATDPEIKHGGNRIRAGHSPSRSHWRGAAPDAAMRRASEHGVGEQQNPRIRNGIGRAAGGGGGFYSCGGVLFFSSGVRGFGSFGWTQELWPPDLGRRLGIASG